MRTSKVSGAVQRCLAAVLGFHEGFWAVEAAFLGTVDSTTFGLLSDYLNHYGALTASQLQGSIPVSKLLSACLTKSEPLRTVLCCTRS